MPKIIENLREKIIEEGKDTLLKGNYADFSIRKIAKKCGIGTGTVYNYFQNKEELALEIFKNDWDKTLYVIDSLKDKNQTLKTKLYEIYCALEEFVRCYMSIFMEIAAGKAAEERKPHEYYGEVFVRMEQFIEYEKLAGRINSTVPSAKLSYFVITTMIYNIRNGYMSFDELIECMKL